MSVLVKVLEQRAHWAERDHLAEARLRKTASLVRLFLLLVVIYGLYLYHTQIVDVVQRLVVK